MRCVQQQFQRLLDTRVPMEHPTCDGRVRCPTGSSIGTPELDKVSGRVWRKRRTGGRVQTAWTCRRPPWTKPNTGTDSSKPPSVPAGPHDSVVELHQQRVAPPGGLVRFAHVHVGVGDRIPRERSRWESPARRRASCWPSRPPRLVFSHRVLVPHIGSRTAPPTTSTRWDSRVRCDRVWDLSAELTGCD
jgi:hypothetical protein